MSIRYPSVQVKTPNGTSYHTSPENAPKEIARQEKRELNPNRPLGNNLGWQVKHSGGYPVWQLVEGGKYRIFVDRDLVPE
jgi:hypothetical protein